MANFSKHFLNKQAQLNGPFLAIVMISLTAVLTHGLAIPRLGYYYDDWYMLWSGASRGAASLVPLFSMDRPFMGVIYSFFYGIIRDNVLGWHVFALLFRIAGALAFYWILTIVWPKLKSISVLAAMIFVVFPGFLAEPNAATKINHLIGYGSALFSIAFTLQAAKTSRSAWKYGFVGLSILLMAFYLWIYEYMIGLEVMRISLLFWIQWQGERDKVFATARKVFLAFIPHLFVIAVFLYWRTFVFESTRSATDLRGLVTDYRSEFVNMTLRLVFQVIKDFFSSTVFAWFVQAYHLFAKAEYGEMAGAFLAAALLVLLAGGYLYAVRKQEGSTQAIGIQPVADLPAAGSPLVLVVIGCLSTLGAVFPVVLSNRFLNLMDPYKGYALHPSAGVMITLIGLILLLKPNFRTTVLIALLALSVATQSMNVNYWANYWEIQRGLWWQLTWRAPDIEDNTLVMAYLPDGYVFQQDYEVWGPINLIYRPYPLSIPRIQSEVLNQDTVFDVLAGRVTDPYVRDIFLGRDFNNFLLISQPTVNACMHVIDGEMPAYSTSERPIIEKTGSFSDLSRIVTSAAPPVPPADIFGQEPEHGWCYYYQQAALARQMGDWSRIAALYQMVEDAGLKAGDRSEYFVFIEGLANQGRADEAAAIAKRALEENDALRYSLCNSLSSAPEFPISFGYRRAEISQIVCGNP